MVWLLNPSTAAVVVAMILWIVVYLMNGSVLQAAFWYGLVVHFRIYPIIYALPIILVLDPCIFQSTQNPILVNWASGEVGRSESSIKALEPFGIWTATRQLFTRWRILFGLVSGAVFLSFTALFFYLYGWEFLNEALLYHLTRTDPRHNFSIYFYHIYLHSEHEFSVVEKVISFLPQLLVQLVLIFSFAKDLPFCLFLQTLAFVALNKVITAQYFVWFLCLLPLIIPWCNIKLKWKGLGCMLLWMGSQTNWLLWGYLLEFKGKNVLLELWLASLLFLAANTVVLITFIRFHKYSPLFKQLDYVGTKNAVKSE